MFVEAAAMHSGEFDSVDVVAEALEYLGCPDSFPDLAVAEAVDEPVAGAVAGVALAFAAYFVGVVGESGG